MTIQKEIELTLIAINYRYARLHRVINALENAFGWIPFDVLMDWCPTSETSWLRFVLHRMGFKITKVFENGNVCYEREREK